MWEYAFPVLCPTQICWQLLYPFCTHFLKTIPKCIATCIMMTKSIAWKHTTSEQNRTLIPPGREFVSNKVPQPKAKVNCLLWHSCCKLTATKARRTGKKVRPWNYKKHKKKYGAKNMINHTTQNHSEGRHMNKFSDYQNTRFCFSFMLHKHQHHLPWINIRWSLTNRIHCFCHSSERTACMKIN